MFLTCILVVLGYGCKKTPSPIAQNDEKAFNAYWYDGKAEISSYKLNQSRYGANHEGTVVMIFVTEDFSKSKLVKLDDPQKFKSDAVKVMKLNMNKEFVTGIYKYNMMSSVFTPVDYAAYPHSLKLTTGSQEWCGQSFMQVTWKGNRYDVQQYSYFQSEGDLKYTLTSTWLEDEIWNKIRVAPNTLPLGKVKMIASAFYLRLSHKENKVYEAEATLKTTPDQFIYSISYPELKRTLDIHFELAFPYRILGWKEVYGNNEVTTAQIMQTVKNDYWMHNHPADVILRDSLSLNN